METTITDSNTFSLNINKLIDSNKNLTSDLMELFQKDLKEYNILIDKDWDIVMKQRNWHTSFIIPVNQFSKFHKQYTLNLWNLYSTI